MAEEAGDAFDKLKAGVKAVAKKVTDPNRDLGTEYEKEKIKEGVEITNEMYLELMIRCLQKKYHHTNQQRSKEIRTKVLAGNQSSSFFI